MHLSHLSSPSFHDLSPIKGEALIGAARARATWWEAGPLGGGDEEGRGHPGSEAQRDYGICQKSLRAPQR